jgi:hypothetical protein
VKPRFSFEEHVEMGRALASMRDELVHRVTQLANAYPRSGPPAVPGQKLNEAVRAIDVARSELENALFREHPEVAETTVYCPPSEERARAFPDSRRV